MAVSSPRAAPGQAPAAAVRPAGLTGTDALLALMTLIWGVNYIVIKAAFRVFSPLSFNAVRFLLAAAGVALVAWAAGARRPSRRELLRLSALGVLGNTVYQLCYIEGMARTRAGNAALIMAAVPVLTAVSSHLLGHDRLRWRDVAGLALSTAGIAVLVGGSGADVGLRGTLAGDLLMLLAVVFWTAYTVLAKPLVDTLGPTATTAWTMGLGAIPLLLVCTPAALAQRWGDVTPAAWLGAGFSSLGSLVLAYLIWYRGVARLGATRTAFYSNFSPVVTLLAAWPLLGEVPTAWQIVGAGGIFGSLALVRS
ncbi:MAG TPA: DMT family transporter [Gemmatimonadales bacterium]|nr:DMT family transporter [Gemmatimonadales bacterium]